jgi:5-(carboxyamino)imidazole ribonucleotide synthase
MRNLLGDQGAAGIPRLRGVEDLLSQAGCHLHWYGKRVVKPNRKMGHITVTGETLESAMQACSRVESSLGVAADVHGMKEA